VGLAPLDAPEAVADADLERGIQFVAVALPPLVPDGATAMSGLTLEPPFAAANSHAKAPFCECWLMEAEVSSAFFGPPEDLKPKIQSPLEDLKSILPPDQISQFEPVDLLARSHHMYQSAQS
jgi:hypothetical protein